MEPCSPVKSPVARLTSRDFGEFLAVLLFFFVVAGNPPPAVNEAHYLIKSRHFWDVDFLASDGFVSSGNAHLAFYATVGWLTKWFSLPAVAWIGRLLGWSLIAAGLVRLVRRVIEVPWASVIVALVWVAGVREANLAGEWVIGGIEGKVLAFGFVLWGWDSFCCRNPARGWVYLGIASAFHVLVGGWSVLATLIARSVGGMWGLTRAPWTRHEWCGLICGGAISLVGVIPGLGLGVSREPNAADWAAQIQVYGRLTHHLNPASFPTSWFIRYGILVGVMISLGVLLRASATSRLSAASQESAGGEGNQWNLDCLGFMLRLGYAGLALSCIGLLLGIVTAIDRQVGANLLRFYWFRFGDAICPLVLGLLVASFVFRSSAFDVWQRLGRGIAWTLVFASALSLGRDYIEDQALAMPEAVSQGNLLVNPSAAEGTEESRQIGVGPSGQDRNQDVYREWLDVCQWVRQRTPVGAVFITPRHQQTFKWYAERAEVVNWKDIPQDASSIVDWGRRLNQVFPLELGRRHPPSDLASLRRLGDEYGASFLLIDRRWLPEVSELERVYPEPGDSNQTYWVYRLPKSAVSTSATD